MPVPGVPWGGRDTSALSHELIHRWVHDGADPAAIDSARVRHAARGEELRAAAQRLERAHGELGSAWRGRDADAASAHVRTLVARMSRLGDAVTGQAGSLQGVRDALTRVQALVGPPRPPALPVLGASPATPGLAGALAAGGPPDGFGTFHAAQADERAAQSAYRAYLEHTGLAARGAPSAVDGLAGRATPGGAGPSPATARGGVPATATPGSVGSGAPARGGVLARAAAPPRSAASAFRPGGPAPSVGGGVSGRPTAGAGPGGGGSGPGPGVRPGPWGRFVSRLLGAGAEAPPAGSARGPGGAGSGGRPVGPGGANGPGGRSGPGGPGGTRGSPGAGTPGAPASPVAPTAADRLAGGAAPGRAGGDARRDERRGRPGARPGAGSPGGAAEGQATGTTPSPTAGTTPGMTTPGTTPALGAGAAVGSAPAGHPGLLGGAPVTGSDPTGPSAPSAPSATPGHGTGGPGDAPLLPSTGGAAGAVGAVGTGSSGVRHPEYLVDADPWRDPADDPDERRLVTPPVLGEHDDR